MLSSKLTGLLPWASLVLIQQTLAAGGSWTIAQAIQALQKGEDSSRWLTFALFGMFLPYLPAIASRPFIKKWELSQQRAWAKEWWNSYQGRIDLYADRTKRDASLALLQQEGPLLISQICTLLPDLVGFILNLVFQWGILTLFYSETLGATLAVGMLSSSLILLSLDRWTKRSAQTAALSGVKWSSLLPTAWDAALPLNPKSTGLWKERFERFFSEFKEASLRSTWRSQATTALALFTLFVPLSWILLSTPQREISATESLLILASFPRVLQTLQSAMNATVGWIQLHPLRVRLEHLRERLPAPTDTPSVLAALEGRISHELRGRIGDISLLPVNPGRITLRGPNGSGKSSLILKIKAELGPLAYYLSPQSDLPLSEKRDNTPYGSTGESKIQQIQELLNSPPAPVLLLDEWDANLDAQWIQKLDQRIEELARQVKVIEVRHRGREDLPPFPPSP